MKILIVGCGKIGTTILQSLVAEGHDVVAIDNSPETISEISNIYDAMYVVGNGADCETLAEAGVDNAELLVSVTNSDEFNMLSCFLAKKMGAKHTIARIRNPEYNDSSLGFMKQQLDLSSAINPDLMAAQDLYNILKLPSAVNVETFSRKSFEMIEIKLKPDSALDGKTLIEIRKEYDAKFLVCTVLREDEIFIPDGNFVLHSGDRINITAERAELMKLLRMLGLMQKQSKSVMILGASRIAYYLAKMLTGSGSAVKIIEQDKQRCAEFANILPKATIICGDGAKKELLLEEGISDMDAFVSLTGMDEENILISYFVSTLNVPKIVTKVNRSELSAIAENLGLDSIVSPTKIVSDVLTRYARALENSIGSSVETLYKIADGKAEALEFIVQNEFEWCEIPLSKMKIKDNILVAGIIRGRAIVIPNGNDMILPGDRVIIVAAGTRLKDLSDIME